MTRAVTHCLALGHTLSSVCVCVCVFGTRVCVVVYRFTARRYA